MKYSTVEDAMASFHHPVLLTVQGEPNYQTINATIKFLPANSRAIGSHLGGGTLGHLGLIISDASYAMIAPTTNSEPTPWITPQAPGWAPATMDGTAAQISAAHHIWEEDVRTYRTCTSIQQVLKKQIISVFEPMYLDILNENMVGYAKILAGGMLDHLFETYDNITAVDLEDAINKHLKLTPATAIGHMNQRHQNIRSTSKAPIEKQPTPDADLGTNTQFEYAFVVNQGQLYTDLTGKFPVRSSKGNYYVMVCYVYDCNYVKFIPMKSRSASEWVKAYDTVHQEITVKGFKPKLQTLDNEASTALKNFFTVNDIAYQLVPPHCHRRNAA
jgi:hypothetical protein